MMGLRGEFYVWAPQRGGEGLGLDATASRLPFSHLKGDRWTRVVIG